MNTTIQEAIVQTLQSGGWLTFFVIFWSGAILSLSSCTIIRIPIIVGYVGGASTSKKRAFLLTLSFVAALVVSYTALGVLFGLLSGLMDSMIRWSQYIYYVIGALAFFIGIQMTGIIDIGLFRHKECGIHHPQRIGLLGAFLFGLVFAIFEAPTCPCCGPVLFIIAGLTFEKGKILYATLIFLTYALGQSFPVLLIGSFTGIVKYITPKVQRIEGAIRTIGGNILIALAVYFFLLG